MRVDGAHDGRRCRAQHVREHLAAERVDAGRLGRLLVLAQRHQRIAETRALDHVRQRQRGREDAEREEVVGARLGELHEQRRPLSGHRDRDLLVAGEVHDDPQDERVGERGQGEVDAGQPERRDPDEDRRGDGDHGAGEDAQPGREARLEDQQDGDVGADAEERLVAEGRLPGIAADDVPGQAHGGPQQHERQDAVVIALAQREGEKAAGHDDQRDGQPAAQAPRRGHHTERSRRPNRPWGRR